MAGDTGLQLVPVPSTAKALHDPIGPPRRGQGGTQPHVLCASTVEQDGACIQEQIHSAAGHRQREHGIDPTAQGGAQGTPRSPPSPLTPSLFCVSVLALALLIAPLSPDAFSVLSRAASVFTPALMLCFGSGAGSL